MSEKRHSPETGHDGEHFKAESKPENHETTKHHEQESDHEKVDSKQLEEMAKEAETKARSKEDLKVEDKPLKEHAPLGVNKQLKDLTFQRTLSRVRHRLSWSDKKLSKVIHQPVVDSLSRFGEKTIARPSGILGAGLITLAGSVVILFQAKHFGFKYNLTLFLLLIIIGYLFGLLIEILTRMFSKKR